ncbi:permease [Romboutsia sp.]|uniref:permease n=1 Tax=Romboutsia sp. TaxID=1965302 RepID=UPI003F2D5611
MTSYILYTICTVLLVISFLKDKNKTKLAIKNGLKSFEAIMPQFLFIIIIVGIILSTIDTQTISSFIGKESGLFGIAFSSIIGSITMMPTFVAFSTGDSLLKSGAGYPQVAALISTLTMVGVLTFSLEAKYIGKRAAFFRNFFAFLFAFIVAFFVGGILG